ncbi:PHP domain-containing protein [bacterium Unc6]|nr:PHP domain-containing protein [bacterium Unc6]
MIDLHTHSLLSDGVLLPSELVRRAYVKGYKVIAITDHIDASNLENVLPGLINACATLDKKGMIRVIPGVEITHVRPDDTREIVEQARILGAKIVLVHGETLVEPVQAGTNKTALGLDIDILTHPGLITLEEARIAAKKGIRLEISCRKGHCLSNGHIVKIAKKAGAKLVLNTDSHKPDDLRTDEEVKKIAIGAGLELEDWKKICSDTIEFVKKFFK